MHFSDRKIALLTAAIAMINLWNRLDIAVDHPLRVDKFEASRALLLGIAYRTLGSLSDAEDAAQDTYLKWT